MELGVLDEDEKEEDDTRLGQVQTKPQPTFLEARDHSEGKLMIEKKAILLELLSQSHRHNK